MLRGVSNIVRICGEDFVQPLFQRCRGVVKPGILTLTRNLGKNPSGCPRLPAEGFTIRAQIRVGRRTVPNQVRLLSFPPSLSLFGAQQRP
jgi:hypothetical protein